MPDVVVLKCPSCGANVEIPASLTRAHCVFCGSDIQIAAEAEAYGAAREADLKIFLDLLKTAMEARSVQDMLRYADKVLELDPNSSDAWYCKGVATCNLSSWESDLYDQARTYLEKALEIDPENLDARVMLQNWPWYYVRYLYDLSQRQWAIAHNVFYAECVASFHWTAERKAAPYAAAPIATLDRALSLIPHMPAGLARDRWESTLVLKKWEFIRSPVSGSRFGDGEPLLRRAQELKAKQRIWEDVKDLPVFREKLQETEAEIATIEEHGGFFDRRKLGNLEKLRQECLERIERAEQLQEVEESQPFDPFKDVLADMPRE